MTSLIGRKHTTLKVALLGPLLVFLGVFFVAPLIVNFTQSIHSGAVGQWLQEYKLIFSHTYYYLVLGQTLALGVVVTVTCLVLAYPLAYITSQAQGWFKGFLLFVIVAPLLINVVIRSYGWMVIFGGAGLLNSVLEALGLPSVRLMYTWTGITIALVQVLVPFMTLSISSVLETLDSSVIEAAQTLGASRLRVFRHIIIPLSMEGIVTGCILTFTLTIGSFVTVMILGNTKTMVLPWLIYQEITSSSNWPLAAALGVVLLVAVILVIATKNLMRQRRRSEVTNT